MIEAVCDRRHPPRSKSIRPRTRVRFLPSPYSSLVVSNYALDVRNEIEHVRLAAFLNLTRVEAGLRAYLTRSLSERLGPRWWHSLPADVVPKVVDGNLEMLDFPDLKKCLASKWRELDELRNVVRRDQLIVHLEELEPIRNALAHSRAVGIRDLALLEATYQLLRPLLNEGTDKTQEIGADPSATRAATLLRTHRAILRVEGIPADTLDELRVLRDVAALEPDILETVERYGRLISLPGRDQEILERARGDALERVSALIRTLETQL